MKRTCCILLGLAAGAAVGRAADDAEAVQAALRREIIGPRKTLLEVQEYTESRVPRMPSFKSAAEWEQHANRLRADVLDKVVYRGAAAAWRDAKTKVEWQQTIAGGPGYRIRKLRYEALPGMWIPALLYEPDNLKERVPAILNVNGHDPKGKAANYKQARCINLAKRGMLALNLEWLGMGQLRGPGYMHYRMNQLDLCGSSGLAPFYLCMKRGLDVLLAHPQVDPERVAVTGLSGGGWQTIFISALDTRVKLTDPVAGYSSFRTRARHFKDLGDSEQTPCDLGTVADYTHLTAMMAPRPTLLTYNAKDDCCFEAGYALPPLLEAAAPIFKLYGKETNLRSHVNHHPGTHNYFIDNRQAFYRMVGDHFSTDPRFDAQEIPCVDEIKFPDELNVQLPERNADFHSLAMSLMKDLPREAALPTDADAARRWQQERRQRLRDVIRAKDYQMQAAKAGEAEKNGLRAVFWRFTMDKAWTVPAVELSRGEPKATALVVADAGRAGAAATVRRLLDAGERVLAVDPFYFGESRVQERDSLFALIVATVGDRPLGIQASQVAAVARWARAAHPDAPLKLVAVGPRSSAFALAAAGLEEKAVDRVELENPLGSLKEVIEQNRGVNEMPELFCFGLLEAFDVQQLAALVAPRPLTLVKPGERARKELAGLKGWYATLGGKFELPE